jgi:hypothetical protein
MDFLELKHFLNAIFAQSLALCFSFFLKIGLILLPFLFIFANDHPWSMIKFFLKFNWITWMGECTLRWLTFWVVMHICKVPFFWTPITNNKKYQIENLNWLYINNLIITIHPLFIMNLWNVKIWTNRWIGLLKNKKVCIKFHSKLSIKTQ